MANRCVTPRRDAVGPSATRRVLRPVQLRVSGSDTRANAGVPSSVTFGGSGERNQRLYVRFEPYWADLEVTAAFLVLTPHPDSAPQAAGVRVRVARIAAAWDSGRSPKTAHPTVQATATGIAGSPLRIDVTHTLQYVQSQAAHSHGFALSALDTHVPGVVYSTGVGLGVGPYLEVYGNPH